MRKMGSIDFMAFPSPVQAALPLAFQADVLARPAAPLASPLVKPDPLSFFELPSAARTTGQPRTTLRYVRPVSA